MNKKVETSPDVTPPKFTTEQRFQIMAHLISKQAKGIYVEPMNYRPFGIDGDIPDVIFQFYIHIPVNVDVVQQNQSNKTVRTKRTFVCLFVEPPEYPHIRKNKDMRLEMERFLCWKREVTQNESYKKLQAFCEKYDWYLMADAFDVELYAQIKKLSEFNGKNDYGNER